MIIRKSDNKKILSGTSLSAFTPRGSEKIAFIILDKMKRITAMKLLEAQEVVQEATIMP